MKSARFRLTVAVVLGAAGALAPGGEAAAQSTQPGDPASAKALVSQPIVPAQRDGTLGVPSIGAGGVSALINNRISANTKDYGVDFFAQVGRLVLSDNWDFDLLGETFSASVPSVAISPPSAIRPLVLIKQPTFETIGFRLSWSSRPKATSTRRARDCLTHLMAVGANNLNADQKSQCKSANIDPSRFSGQVTDEQVRATLTEQATQGAALMLGGRLLYAGTETNPVGLAGEAAGQYGAQNWNVFVSGVVLGLSKTDDQSGATVLETEKVIEAKLGLGASWTFSGASGGTVNAVRPRLGLYLSGSRNWWTNPYAAPGTEADIRGYQLEGSLYASGHFTGGFSGLFAFSVVRPYGHESDVQYVISIAPSLGTALP